ncbi:hypothetical protein E4U53_002083 [Claviceps sorghi]|nr:hypothetical protein E4U53_002083 [Claviceps sorghi]
MHSYDVAEHSEVGEDQAANPYASQPELRRSGHGRLVIYDTCFWAESISKDCVYISALLMLVFGVPRYPSDGPDSFDGVCGSGSRCWGFRRGVGSPIRFFPVA